jgi:hypothetical protein
MTIVQTHRGKAPAATSTERVLQAQAKLRTDLVARPDPAFWGEVALSYLPWAPAVDRQTIPDSPIDRIRAGAAAEIDLMVGSNTEETPLFLLADGAIDRTTEDALSAIARAYGLSAEGLSAYRATHPSASPGELFSAIQTDWYWRHARPRNTAASWPRSSAIACHYDARGLGSLRHQRRLWLAKVRCRPQADDALRHDVGSRGRSSGRDAHPREEHLLPLHVVVGAAGSDPGRRMLKDIVMGAVESAFQFG